MKTNNELVAEIYELGLAVAKRNSTMGSNIAKVIIPLLKYDGDLNEATKEDLLLVKGLGETTVGYISRVLGGEDIALIVADVPKKLRIRERFTGRHNPYQDRGEFNGVLDNVVRALEGD